MALRGGIRDRNATHEGGPLAKEVRLFGEIVNSDGVRDPAALREAALAAPAVMGR
ncbi:hypothetical protein ACFV2X_39940 [Streptomyces sp. NPDC059679]|uniref:hypothetical protein n=1 Tax=Streptomyces sp. NPDC059679 TaxID=3346903 RepID=UPI003697CAEC